MVKKMRWKTQLKCRFTQLLVLSNVCCCWLAVNHWKTPTSFLTWPVPAIKMINCASDALIIFAIQTSRAICPLTMGSIAWVGSMLQWPSLIARVYEPWSKGKADSILNCIFHLGYIQLKILDSRLLSDLHPTSWRHRFIAMANEAHRGPMKVKLTFWAHLVRGAKRHA